MHNSYRRHFGASLRVTLLASSGLGWLFLLPAQAQTTAANDTQQQSEQVLIEGQRPMDYYVQAPSLPKLTEPLVDTPQSIDTISQQELKDRAITNLNDAFRDVPSITIGAGEFKSLGNSPTIRGFVARTDMFIDGQRDIGDYFREPFNMEEIQSSGRPCLHTLWPRIDRRCHQSGKQITPTEQLHSRNSHSWNRPHTPRNGGHK